MDKESARRAIEHFKYVSQPSSAVPSNPATVADIQKLIKEISKLSSAIIDSIDS